MLAEDALEEHLVRRIERRGNATLTRVSRMVFSPSRMLANVAGLRVPWYRTDRGLLDEFERARADRRRELTGSGLRASVSLPGFLGSKHVGDAAGRIEEDSNEDPGNLAVDPPLQPLDHIAVQRIFTHHPHGTDGGCDNDIDPGHFVLIRRQADVSDGRLAQWADFELNARDRGHHGSSCKVSDVPLD